MLFDHGYATESSSPYVRGFDEQGTEYTSEGTSEDEGHKLKELPIEMVADFEQNNLFRAVWVEEL
jgi:hypothetical protein